MLTTSVGARFTGRAGGIIAWVWGVTRVASRAADRGALRRVAAGFLGTLAVSNLAGAGRSSPVEPLFPEKIALWRSAAPALDCVFVGSSHVYRHVDPSRVDAEWTSDRGGRSFNLGIPALTLVEQRRLVGELARRPAGDPEPPRRSPLRVVALEPILTASAELRNLATTRSLDSHGLADTRTQIHQLWQSRDPVRRRLWYGGIHVLAFGLHLLRWTPLETTAGPELGGYLPVAGLGYMSAGDGTGRDPHDPGRRFLAEGAFEAAVAARVPFQDDGPLLPPDHLALLDTMVDRVRASGAQPVLLLTPRLDWALVNGTPALDQEALHCLRRTWSRQRPAVPLLSYYDVPDFLQRDLWYDSHHMNRTGAASFSARLGRDLEGLARDGRLRP